jgi:di/tricarboxylate transporter
VSGYIAGQGMRPIGLFELTPIGLVLVAVGLAYLLTLGRRLLPDNAEEPLLEEYEVRRYLSEIRVPPESSLVGQRIFASELSALGVRVLRVERDGETFLPAPDTAIHAGDLYVVQGRGEDLVRVKEKKGIDIVPDAELADFGAAAGPIRVVEMLVTPLSDLRDRSLPEARFRERYGLTVLAIYRHGHPLADKLAQIRLRSGDLVLVQGPEERLSALRRHPDLWLLDPVAAPGTGQARGWVTLAAFGLALGATFLGWLPLPIAMLGASLVAIFSRAITIDEAYAFVDWRLLILIGGMTAFGLAMQDSGAAAFLADGIVGLLAPWGELAVVAGFVVLTVLLTQPMSNAAAALVVLPVALEAARALGADERSFAIAILLGASVSFITPFEPSCLLVYGPGKYRFRDFVIVGLPLTVMLILVVLLLLPRLWPLHP